MAHRKRRRTPEEVQLDDDELTEEQALPPSDYCAACGYPRSDCVCTDADLQKHARDFYSKESEE